MKRFTLSMILTNVRKFMSGILHKSLMLLSFVFIFASTAFAQSGGTGTSGDPYLISNLADLQTLSTTTSLWSAGLYFEQTADIDAAGATPAITPIGNNTDNFFGNYDGKDFAINNLTIYKDPTAGSSNSVGLFGKISGATIQNLVLTNVTITGASSVGGLFGNDGGGSTITSCSVTSGTISGTNSPGGLVGWVNGSSITDCYASASVTSSGGAAGGLLGGMQGPTITSCYATGVVDGGILVLQVVL